VYAGHLATKNEYGYSVSTLSGVKILFYLIQNFKISPRWLIFAPVIAMLEVYCRILGYLDVKSNKKHTVWQVTPSTKTLYLTTKETTFPAA
jgi:hypothetical protein